MAAKYVPCSSPPTPTAYPGRTFPARREAQAVEVERRGPTGSRSFSCSPPVQLPYPSAAGSPTSLRKTHRSNLAVLAARPIRTGAEKIVHMGDVPSVTRLLVCSTHIGDGAQGTRSAPITEQERGRVSGMIRSAMSSSNLIRRGGLAAVVGVVLGIVSFVALNPLGAAPETILGSEGENSPRSLLDKSASEGSGPGRWRWIEDTYWYVPNSGLPAYVFSADDSEPRRTLDQTVYHIADYRNGYFWGETVVQLGTSDPSCLTLAGSVTPEGAIHLTFIPKDPNLTEAPTVGVGMMRNKKREWTMENQMSSGPGSQLQVLHWAYMYQSQPKDPSWKSLPGVDMSVKEFMAQCPVGQ
jgi:hypothetical protein